MKSTALIFVAIIGAAVLGAPALAANYPVSGNWGPADAGKKGAIDCAGKRGISFNGDTRTDSKGGVPGYRLKSLTTDGSAFRITDEFTTGQIRNGSTSYTLRQTDADHIEMHSQGGTQKLQRCK